MPAGLTDADSMMSVREKPWHGLGVVLEEAPRSIDEALVASGLDWEVAKVPVFYRLPQDGPTPTHEQPEYRRVRDTERQQAEDERGGIVDDPNPGLRDVRLTVRGDTGEPLGVVSRWYEVVQNREAFSFLAELIGSELHFETAGSLFGGRRVWVLVKLPEWVEIGGDAVETYVHVDTRHDGRGAVHARVSPTRIVCQNTLRAAIEGAVADYIVHHLGDPSTRLAEARSVLEVTIDFAQQFKALGDRLASEKVTDQKVRAVLKQLYPTTESMTEQTRKNREGQRAVIEQLFSGGGPTVGNAPGSKWALYNSICEYVDYYGGTKLEERPRESDQQRISVFRRAVDDPDGKKAKAFALVTA